MIHTKPIKQLLHYRFWLAVGLLVIDYAFFGLTDPTKVASIWLIVAFGLFAGTIYCLMRGLLVLIGWYGVHLKHAKRLAATMAGLLSGVMALQSIGELSSRDVAVLLPLAVIFYAYTSYGRLNPHELQS